MNVRRMPSAPPTSPASNTTLSRGDAAPDLDASVVVQSSWANTNAAESTSWGEFDEPVEGGPPWVERGRPGLDVGDVLEPAHDRLEQFLAGLPITEEMMRGWFMWNSSADGQHALFHRAATRGCAGGATSRWRLWGTWG